MNQEELFKAYETDKDAAEKYRDLIEKAVHRVGLKEFAFMIGISPSQVRDAINGNGKYFAVDWQVTLLRVDSQAREALINFLCDIANKQHPLNKIEETPEEKLAIVDRIVKQHNLELIFKELYK